MRILKPGDPCPCCGQPIPEGLPMEKIVLLSYIQDVLEERESLKGDGENEDVPLTKWVKAQCLLRGCDDFPAETPQEIDELVCECVTDCPECPIALAYCFASQACHLRDRLKMYENILFAEDGTERLTLDDLQALVGSDEPLTPEDLRKMAKDKPVVVWTICLEDDEPLDPCSGEWDMFYDDVFIGDGTWDTMENYGKQFVAYRRRPKEAAK